MNSIKMFINFVFGIFRYSLPQVKGRFVGFVGYSPDDYEIWHYKPNNGFPFAYITNNGSIITPGEMITDGVSVPKWLGWFGYETLTSKYFLKAGLIHDWLFDACERDEEIVIGHRLNGTPIYNHEMSFTRANMIFAEAIRTEMEEHGEIPDENVIAMFFSAVQEFGREAWENKGFHGEKMQAYKEGVA